MPATLPLPAKSAIPEFQDREGSLVGKIAADIARSIAEGKLAPGDDLNSVELAARFGTSRTPVREALMLLEKEGLVEIPPRRRPRVARVSVQEIEEIYQIRALLNGYMMELFVAHAPDSVMVEASVRLQAMESAAGDPERFFTERERLHNLWADYCGNGTLKKALATWRSRMSLRRLGVGRADQIERSMIDHRRLLLACEERDAALAATLIRSMTLMGLKVIMASGWAGGAGASEVPTR